MKLQSDKRCDPRLSVRLTTCHPRADCQETGISSVPNDRNRIWDDITFFKLGHTFCGVMRTASVHCHGSLTVGGMLRWAHERR